MSLTDSPSAPGSHRRRRDPIPDYLTGVQGLRTVAALLVAIYHIWFGRVSGAVDVFFVVAGYFAAKSLLKMAPQTRLWDQASLIGAYWVRTLRRIIPSTVTVVAGTAIMAFLWLPVSQTFETIRHGFASLLFYENWYLIATSRDYLAQDDGVSPYQQFWALALQMQFYVLLPLALLVALRLGRLLRLSSTAAVVLIGGAMAAASFAYAVWYTHIDQPVAYFHTFTRAWEFLAGAILFVLLRYQLRSRLLAHTLGWVGLIALIGLGATVDVSRLFPGVVALVPVTAAVLVMVAAASNCAPVLLQARPLVAFGDSSFAFYLWHWPLMLVYRRHIEADISLLGGLGILAAAALLAWLTTVGVENPFRFAARLVRSAPATIGASLAMLAPAVAILGTWHYSADNPQVYTRLPLPQITIAQIPLQPPLAQARDDYVEAIATGCQTNVFSDELKTCDWGPAAATYTVAVVGGSHSSQWVDVIRQGLAGHDAQVVSITKGSCVFGDLDGIDEEFDPTCATWNQQLLTELDQLDPDIIVTIATRIMDGKETVPPGYHSHFARMQDRGIAVVGIRENPQFDQAPARCLEDNDYAACAIDRDEYYTADIAAELAPYDNVTFVDVADDLCGPLTCGPIDDNLLIYRDRQHLTRTWTMAKGTRVPQAILGVLEELAQR